MTEEHTPIKQPDEKPAHEQLSLIDLLAIRLSYERTTADIHQHLIAKCRQSKDPVVRALDLSDLEHFCSTLTEHTHLLTQALDVLGDNTTTDHLEHGHEPFLMIAKAALKQVSDPAVGVLPTMQALLAMEQLNEATWGLLLALMKDADLQRFITHFQHACMRHHAHRVAVQKAYEDVALGMVRRNQLTMKSKRPLHSSIVGRAGLLFPDARHL